MNRMALKIKMLDEQRGYRFISRMVGKCVWCGLPGGDGAPPHKLTPEEKASWGALDLHEWLIKRGRASDDIVFSAPNVVLAHHKCHIDYGQTKEFARKCCEYKQAQGYDISAWIRSLDIKVTQDMGACLDVV